jgi:hypothetical protein
MTGHMIIRNRIWIILAVILLGAIIIPSQFRKGGIDSDLLFSIPVVILVLGYLYISPFKTISITEKVLIPLILGPVIYFIVTTLMHKILDRIFNDYNMDVDRTMITEFCVNLLYFCSLTLPLIGIMKIYQLTKDRVE